MTKAKVNQPSRRKAASRGKDTVLVVAAQEYQRLAARSRQARNLVEFFAESPLSGVNLDLDRPRDHGRKVEL